MPTDMLKNKREYGKILPAQSLGKTFFIELSQRDPNEIILIHGEKDVPITTGQFIQTTNKIARQLKKLGVQSGDIISIIARNSWQYLSLTIAIFYVGATALLLNPEYTAGEYKHFFEMCPPKLIICAENSLNNILEAQSSNHQQIQTILLDEAPKISNISTLGELLAMESGESFEPVEVDVDEDVAVIITSSGTTGLPKAVMLTHSNVNTTLSCVGDEDFVIYNNTVRTIDYLPYFHILGLSGGLSGVQLGTKAVVMEKFQPDIFLRAIEKYRVCTLLTVPPILLFFVKNSMVEKYDISSLVNIFCSGTVLKKEIEEKLKICLNNAVIRQVYGMSEMTGGIMCTTKQSDKKGSVGRPLHSVSEVVVVDKDGKAIGPHERGEIRLKGKGVMKGYYNNEKETKLAFDENGFLKTGDLGYYDDDGDFYIVGRCKEIIKYKGFQVAPAELEGLLLKHDAIEDAGVIGKPDERAGELPMAFVVKNVNKPISENDILQYIEDNVCMQKWLHGGVRFVQEIPKNASGKILRKKLYELL